MIERLNVRNVALIENSEIEFGMGLNIISGETGAGKSMLIDSINFLLGERVGKDFIRHSADSAYVEGEFFVPEDARAVFGAHGLDIGGDGALVISRTVSAGGKGSCRVNGRAVTVGQLREVSAALVDVHGQHEHQSLLNPAKHIMLLDKFCGEKMDAYKAELAGALRNYRDVQNQIKNIVGAEKSLDTRMEFLEAQKNDIESAKLTEDEEDMLLERRKALLHYEKLTDNAGTALELLYGNDDDTDSAADRIGRSVTFLNEIAELDSRLAGLAETLESVSAQLEDVMMELRHYYAQLEHDPNELAEIEDRLNDIYKLKRKYGGGIKEILEVYNKICAELDDLQNSGKRLGELNALKKKYTEELLAAGKKMSDLRKSAADEIKGRIMSELNELGMKHAVFDIGIVRRKEIGGSGYDIVEFLISTNTGEEPKPLAKIASGGEVSRIMLAMKTVLADSDNIETLIFDEIDSGVSGRTAQKVAEKLALISQGRQILCITHLPQIAAMGDRHFLIEKKSDEYSTRTDVYTLDFNRSVLELARLIGGAEITEATLAAADELKRQAVGIKQQHERNHGGDAGLKPVSTQERSAEEERQ